MSIRRFRVLYCGAESRVMADFAVLRAIALLPHMPRCPAGSDRVLQPRHPLAFVGWRMLWARYMAHVGRTFCHCYKFLQIIQYQSEGNYYVGLSFSADLLLTLPCVNGLF